MSFPKKVKDDALIRSKRSCCVCQEFCRRNCTVHHIIQETNGGPNTLDNAIVLCPNCHGDAGHYNRHHPLGNKYSPEELRGHRDKWWKWCDENPDSPPPKCPIKLSLSVIDLGKDDWQVVENVNIQNCSDLFFYEIWIKIEILSSEIKFDDVKIDLLNFSDMEDFEFNGRKISGQIIGFVGYDSEERSIIFIKISIIKPKEILTLKFQNISKTSLSPENDHKLSLKIRKFSEKPGRKLRKRDGSVAQSFEPPEFFKQIGIRIFPK